MGYEKLLLDIYNRLYQRLGPSHWWPAKSRMEILVGAILTQNTSWKNVEKAIIRLQDARLLTYHELLRVDEAYLARIIQPAGYFRQKSLYLKNLIYFLRDSCRGDLELLFCNDLMALRDQLLKVKGVGKETADSILLYAGNMPIFVIDAYTKRLFSRLELFEGNITYEKAQEFFMKNLPLEAKFFNEYHALIVRFSHAQCLKNPRCDSCPLGDGGHPFICHLNPAISFQPSAISLRISRLAKNF